SGAAAGFGQFPYGGPSALSDVPIVWQGTYPSQLDGSSPKATLRAINDAGDVVGGRSKPGEPVSEGFAFAILAGGSALIDLSTYVGGEYCWTPAINNLRMVAMNVGLSATAGFVLVDLNNLPAGAQV